MGETAAVSQILVDLPENFVGWWWNISSIWSVMKSGGFPAIPKKIIEQSFRSCRSPRFVRSNYYKRVTYHLYGKISESSPKQKYRFSCPKEQSDYLKETNGRLPRISTGYFEQNKHKYKDAYEKLRKYTDNQHEEPTQQHKPSLSITDNDAALEQLSEDEQKDEEHIVSSNEQQCTSKNSEVKEDNQEDKHSNDEEEIENNQNSQQGYMIVDIVLEDELILKIQEHACDCRNKLTRQSITRFGFSRTEKWCCDACNTCIIRNTSKNIEGVNAEKRGRHTTELNESLNIAMFESAITVEKASNCFSFAGIDHPSERGMRKARNRLENCAYTLSLEQLQKNRIEHVQECRKVPNYSGDITFTDGDGNKRSIARGPIATDGGGAKRAYDHRITGDQHIFNIYSVLTGKCLYVKCDQISCGKCHRMFTKQLAESGGKKAWDITLSNLDLHHDGECFRNSVHGPATAEEYACADAAVALLCDSKTKHFLGDEEAIFADVIVTDGDSRGAKKFIDKQVEALFDYVDTSGIAQQLPDIGHFVKTISNGFYKLASQDPSFRGKNLLEPARIRAISSDVSKHIRTYHDLLLDDNNDKDVLKQKCLSGIEAIIPHHCGNHSKCSPDWCKYMQIKNEQPPTTSHQEIQKIYSKSARFKGISLSVGLQGQEKLTSVITSRCNSTNIDRLARIMSSNKCENYFQMLTKYTEGKRIYYGQRNTLDVLMHWVAGMQANPDLGDTVFSKMGVPTTATRAKRKKILQKKKKSDAKRKRTQEYKDRQSAARHKKDLHVSKETRSKQCHVPNKLPPTDDCKTNKTSTKRKRKPNRCSNCGGNHKTRDCREPSRKKKEEK